MLFSRTFVCTLAGLSIAFPALASDPDYVLVQSYDYASKDLEGRGSGSGSGRTAMAERVIETREDGLVIEYSIPGDQDKIRGNAMWMYPARVLVAPDGSKTLLNAGELKERNLAWRESAEWPPEVCGQWIFTWTAIQILCDPRKVIEEIEATDMRPGNLAVGTTIALPQYGVELVLGEGEPDDRGMVLTATGTVSSDFAKRQAAQAEVIAAKINGKELALEQALADAASITADGEVGVSFIIDENGSILKREERYDITVTGEDNEGEHRTGRVTVFRVLYDDWLIG